MTNSSEVIAAFHALRPKEYPFLIRIEIKQVSSGSRLASLVMTLELGRGVGSSHRLLLTFEHVTDLKVDWPEWSVVKLDVIEIEDVSARGLEDQRFRIYEGSGLLALACADFNAKVSE